jgi:hypothetical protein
MFPFRSCFLLLAACGLPLAASAADDDTISTDRPDFVESSQVVGKGRLQLETSLQWERDRADGVTVRTLTTPALLRIGLSETTELRFETDGRTVAHAGGATEAGYADTSVGIKWHTADQAGAAPSLGVLLHADLPSGSVALRGSGVRPSLRLAAEWELADGLSFGVMPGVATDNDERGARRGYGIAAATLGKDLGERLHGFVELAAPRVARADRGGTQASFDTGVTWLLTKDIQLDAALTRGLNRRTPDLTVGLGLSVRR